MDEEFKTKAIEALTAGAAAAKRLGGMACDLGKKGYATAKEKARELKEKAAERSAQEQAEAERRRQIVAELQQKNRMSVRQSDGGRAVEQACDREDKCFYMSYGWLYLIWWLGNIIDSILCLWWFASAAQSSYTRDTAWVALVVWPLLLLFNRLAYEGAVAVFEIVRHLRQIRDELHRHNQREEKRSRIASEKEQEPGTPVDAGNAEGAENGGTVPAVE